LPPGTVVSTRSCDEAMSRSLPELGARADAVSKVTGAAHLPRFHPLCLDRSAVEGWPSRDRG